MPRQTRKPPAEPTQANLHDAALAHLARYGATQAGLLRVLDRRIARWAATVPGADPGPARAAARNVVARLTASGAVDDRAFAEARLRSLSRAGKSGRAIGAHLSARGVPHPVAAETMEGATTEERELAAAAIHVRRRRLGAFRVTGDSPEQRRREFGSLARAGFPGGIAAAALRMTQEEAEALIARFRAEL